tara:strand:- start:2469 stop:6215 length:3747 start_codon:yes stop_codon:yes gene_type:complete
MVTGEEMMLDAMMAATDAMAIGPIEERLDKLAARLDKFDKAATLAMLGGLLTDPDLHANAVRFEVLIHLVALRANGTVRPRAAQLREWLNEILGEDRVGHQEDPPEDVFVANVVSGAGNSLLFEGIWEANAAYVQAVLYAVTACGRDGSTWAPHCLRQASALLNLSTAIAERSGLSRNITGGGRRLARVQFPTRRIDELSARVRFTLEELAELEIEPFDLRPFVFDPGHSAVLRSETISWTSLEARPILMDGDEFVVALPTAIGAAIRRRALEMALNNEEGEPFQEKLTDYQFGNSVMSARIGLGLDRVTGPDGDARSGAVEMICTFDVGAYAHVIFVQDDVEEVAEEGFRSVKDVSADVRRLVNAGIATIKAMPDFRIGMTILAFGGLGRGFMADPGRVPPEWPFVGLGAEDLELFADDSNTSALQMYRILDQERQLRLTRSQLVNPNGFLNLYGFVEGNDFEILPEDAERGRTLIQLGTDYLTSVRVRIRRALDKHAVRVEPRNAFVEVRRPSTEMYFADLQTEPSYVSVADAMDGRPAAAIEVAGRIWWITIAGIARTPSRSLSYRVWDMLRNWVVMIAPALAGVADPLPQFISIELTFPEGTDLDAATVADDADPARPVLNIVGEDIRIDCPVDYLRAFGRPDNVGDRWMVETVVQGALDLVGSTDSGLAEQIASSIVKDRSSRHLHVLTPKTAGDFILATAELPSARMMQPEVRAWADIGLAQRSGVAQGDARVVEDTAEAGKLLQKSVEVLWEEIRARLELIDRTSVIEACIDNHNAIDRDRATWRHTAAAVLHLHPREEVMRAAVERESARSEVGLSCRVIIEMAVCTSPEIGGRACSLDDLDFLLAHVSLLCGVASRSDEIHHGFAERIEIKPSGVLRFEDEFAERIHRPFMVALSRDQFDAAAEGYDTFYEMPEQIDDEEFERQTNKEFDAAFAVEYGVTPIRMVDFVSRLGDRAVASGNGRVTVRRSELKADLVAMDGVDDAAADRLLESWTLVPRAKWNDMKPAGASAKDWFPWRFARRLSLLSRPIVQLDDDEDLTCIVSPVIAEHGSEYALRAYNARLPESYFRTEEMKRWVGGAVDRLGHQFNRRVAARLKELGLETEADYLMTRLGGTKEGGDVDVLAWNGSTGAVYVIECKRLLADKTVGEIAERLVEFGPDHVERGGRRGPTRRHLDRFEFLKANLSQVSKATGIAEGSIGLKCCLVTSALVPMQFQREADAYFDIVSDFDGIADHFASRG